VTHARRAHLAPSKLWQALKNVASAHQIPTIRIPTRLVLQVAGHVQSARIPVATMGGPRLMPANADHNSILQTLNRAALLFRASDALGDLNVQMAFAAYDPHWEAQGVNLEITTRQSRGHGSFPKDRPFLRLARQAFVS